MRRSQSLCTAATITVLLLSGCEARIYRAKTTLSGDGSVFRAVYRPADQVADEVAIRRGWKHVTFAERIPHERWSGEIADLPLFAHNKNHSYLATWGDFESPAKLPETIVKHAPHGLPDGRLLVDHIREDYVFVVEDRWKETLTDIVTLDDMHRARQELTDRLIPLAEKIVDEVLGDEYETGNLVAWLKGTGAQWFFEVTDVVFEIGARKERSCEKSLAALMPICERHGLRLNDPAGKLLDGDQLEAAVRKFAAQVLKDKLRRHDGKEVSDREVDEMLAILGLVDRPDNGGAQRQQLQRVVDRAMIETFGSRKAFEETVTPLLSRILGLYLSEILGPARQFQFTLEMPGPVVETNGVMLSDRRVRWTFAATDAFPFGYVMEGRSLTVQTELVKELLGSSALEQRETQLSLVELVRTSEALREILRACAAAHSMAPLYKERDKAAAASATEQSYKALVRLLKLPEEPADSHRDE